jgi:hypothetical protein
MDVMSKAEVGLTIKESVKDVDLDACIIRVDQQLIEQQGGGSVFGPPKSRAGRRIVRFPAMIQAELRTHLERVPGDQADVLVFTSPAGTPMRHSNFYRPRLAPCRRQGRTVGRPFPRPAAYREHPHR